MNFYTLEYIKTRYNNFTHLVFSLSSFGFFISFFSPLFRGKDEASYFDYGH